MARLKETIVNGSLRVTNTLSVEDVEDLELNGNTFCFNGAPIEEAVSEDYYGLCTGDQIVQYISGMAGKTLPLSGGTLTYDFGRIILSYEENAYIDEEGPYPALLSFSLPEIEYDGGGGWLIITDEDFEHFMACQSISSIYDEDEGGRLNEYIEDQTVTDPSTHITYDACCYLFIREDNYNIFDSQMSTEDQRDEDLLYDYKFKITLENGNTWKFMRLQ